MQSVVGSGSVGVTTKILRPHRFIRLWLVAWAVCLWFWQMTSREETRVDEFRDRKTDKRQEAKWSQNLLKWIFLIQRRATELEISSTKSSPPSLVCLQRCADSTLPAYSQLELCRKNMKVIVQEGQHTVCMVMHVRLVQTNTHSRKSHSGTTAH